MKRSASYNEPYQGRENTCALHTLSRLFVHNIIQPDVCPLTYHGEEIPPHEHDTFTSQCGDLLNTELPLDVDRLNPESCKGVRYYISTLMYLYVYHCILEEYPDAPCDGANIRDTSLTLKECLQRKHIPAILASKADDILMMLPEYLYTQVFVMNYSAKLKNHPLMFNGLEDSRYRTFMSLCAKSNLYNGLILKKRDVIGHVLVVSDYNAPTNTYTIKNSWGIAIDKVPGSRFKGPHYKLDHAIDEEEYASVTMNDPIKGVFYMSTYPWEQLFINAGYHPYEPFRTFTVKPTRTVARKVGDVRITTRSVSRNKPAKKKTRSLTRTYSSPQTRVIFSNRSLPRG